MTKHRPRLTAEEWDVIRELRGETVSNVNGNTALDLHLKERGIDKSDVTSVKHWQSSSGEWRFSVVTKEDSNGLTLSEAFKPIIEDLKSYSPKFKKLKRDKLKDPHCLVVDPADIHCGKLSSAYETGADYNIIKATSQVEEGIAGLISKASGFKLDKVFFVIGNDVLHTEGASRKTRNGTPQDMDGMWYDAFLAAKKMYIKGIETLLCVADVHVIFNPANHDYSSGWMLAQTLEAWFRLCPNVTFDVSISHRKYTSYGVNLLGTSHGDGAKMDGLPLLMADEALQMWVDCPMRYFYLHHIHHKQLYKFLAGKDYPE